MEIRKYKLFVGESRGKQCFIFEVFQNSKEFPNIFHSIRKRICFPISDKKNTKQKVKHFCLSKMIEQKVTYENLKLIEKDNTNFEFIFECLI